jgi:hypothetical protein
MDTVAGQAGENVVDESIVVIQCCQLLAGLSGQCGKIRALKIFFYFSMSVGKV